MRRFWSERELYFLLAVGVAAFLWIYVAIGQNPLVSRTIPRVDVRVRNLSANELIVRAPSQVTVRLEGPRSQIALLTPKLIDASVDLAGLRPGDHPDVPITAIAPLDVRVIDLNPAVAFVVLDALVTKRLPVEVTLVGTPPQGVTLGTPRASPTHVEVSGPSRQVDQVRRALVSLDTSTVRQEVLTSLRVRAVDAGGHDVSGLTITPSYIGTTLAAREAVISKVVPAVPTVVGDPLQGMAVTGAAADPGTVTVTGPGTLLQDVESAPTVPVDVTGARADFTRRVALDLPPGVSTSAQEVTVVVHVGRALLSTIFRAVPVRVVGIPAGTTSRVVPERVDVQVEGPEDLMRGLTAQAVSVEVSASGQRAGSHTMTPRAVLPQGVHVLVIRPAQIVLYLSPS